MPTKRLDGSECECNRPAGQCIKGDLDYCPAQEEADDDRCEHGDDYEMCVLCSFDCGLMPSGKCSMVGTEDCDFECPWRDSELFAGSAAWHAKRGHIRSVK